MVNALSNIYIMEHIISALELLSSKWSMFNAILKTTPFLYRN